MVRSNTTRHRCRVRLNPQTFQRFVRQTIVELYGSKPGQRPYNFDNTAMTSLLGAAEEFLENMWDQVKDIARHQNRSTVLIQDFDKWKSVNNFQGKCLQKRRRSLVKMFESEEDKRQRARRSYNSVQTSGKDPLLISVQQPLFQQLSVNNVQSYIS